MTRSRDAVGGGGWKHLQLTVEHVVLIHRITKKMLSQVENRQSRRRRVTALGAEPEQEAAAQSFEAKLAKFTDLDQRVTVHQQRGAPSYLIRCACGGPRWAVLYPHGSRRHDNQPCQTAQVHRGIKLQ